MISALPVWGQITFYLLLIALLSVIINQACDTFEAGSRYLGRKMPPGLRGATINAVGSSLPEFFTTFSLLFFFKDVDGYSGGIATCAGSAIFNAVIIPGLSILVVLFWGIKVNGQIKKIDSVQIRKKVFIRDAVFFILAELALIIMLSKTTMYWWNGLILMGVYLIYVIFLYFQYKLHLASEEEIVENWDEEESIKEESPSFLKALLTLNFRWLLFKNRKMTTGQAWTLLAIGVVAIAIPCHYLAEACVKIAELLNVELFFTTVILAAAATSVPDTIISVRDARRGEYDDSVSNALGSNIFDITVALGLPLLLYGLVYGPVHLKTDQLAGSAPVVQELRVLLLILTIFLLMIFLIGKKMGKIKVFLLFSLYFIFIFYTVARAYPQHFPFIEKISKYLHFNLF